MLLILLVETCFIKYIKDDNLFVLCIIILCEINTDNLLFKLFLCIGCLVLLFVLRGGAVHICVHPAAGPLGKCFFRLT